MEQDQQVPRVHTKVHACHHDYPHQQQQYFDDNSSYNMKADEAESKDNKKKEQEQKGKRRGSGWPKGSRNKKTGLVKLDADISLSVAHGSSYIDDKTFMIKTETTKTREILLGTLKKGTKKHKMTVKNSRKRNKGTNKNKKVSSFVCSVCYREFNRNSNLTRHKRIHSNERRFACEVCIQLYK